MPSARELAYYAVHPNQLRSILQWYDSPIPSRSPDRHKDDGP